METGPGLSLFQGSDNIQLNAATRDPEEDEEQEDIKRREKEIQNRMGNIFDVLENDDDASSVDSSHYEDSVKDTNFTNTVTNSSLQLVTPTKDQAGMQLQNDYGVYNTAENVNSYDLDMITNHRPDPDAGSGGGMMQTGVTEFDMYRQTGTPYVNNRLNDSNSSTLETPYELTKPPNTGYTCKIYEKEVEECTFGENYPYNYETPSNHYNTHPKKYSNNRYQNNVQSKQTCDFGGGDNATSDHMNHCYKTSPNGRPMDDNIAYKAAEYNSQEQLEVMYMVRTREIERLTKKLQQLQVEKEDEKNQLNRKLLLLQTEVNRTNISKNEAQQALVDAKVEITNLQMQMESLKEKNAVLEKTNQNVTEELNIAKGSVIDLQQKIAILERTQALQTNDKTHEKFLKQAQEKHAVEMKNMQTQIDVLTDKLNAKETSYVALEHKLDDVRRAHETLMVEKGHSMNRLAQALEESQAQCRSFMTTNNAQQVMQLQAQVKMLNQEKEELRKNVHELQNKLELAKNDVAQYDSLLATTCEDESDSIRQMKLGELHNKSKSKPVDDITNKLRGELQRCVANQALKRKEINRLGNTLSQREKELEKTMTVAESCRQEAARYAKRVNELEQELKSVLTDQAMKADTQIQKLSDHLNDVKKKYELLRDEKINVEQRLEETLAVNQETLKKLHQETMEQQEKEAVDEYNKEYLEIHAKAIERVKQEAQMERVQLTVQLEQKEKELDHIKKLYINICGTKEQLINDHKNEIKTLKSKYATIESHQKDMEKLESELQTQVKLCDKLNKECESLKSKIIELEKDLAHEKRKKEDHTKKIHSEIERAKQEALNELRNAHPNQEISLLLPDHCSEHLEKINQLQEDCKRLEEKLQIAMQEQKKLSEYETELEDATLKIAHVEISQESWKKKYENTVNERNDLLAKISKLDVELSSLKRAAKSEDSDDIKLKISRFQIENEALKSRCDSLLNERNTYREKVAELETELSTMRKKIGSLEGRMRKSGDVSSNSKNELEKELSHYKDFALLSRLSNSKEGRMNESALDQKIQQLEQDLRDKNEKLSRLKEDFEKIKGERDELVIKFSDQAKQFQQYVNSQNQVSELNLSPRSVTDGTDLQKIKETMAKKVRKEMELKVAKELRGIEEQYLEKKSELEQRHETVLLNWQTKYKEKDQEAETLRQGLMTLAAESEKMKFNQISQLSQIMKSKLELYNRELQTRQLRIEKLEEDLKRKENEVEEEKNLMAQMITKWVNEVKEIKAKETEMSQEIQKFKSKEEELHNKIKTLKDQEKELKSDMDLWKHKYQVAKKTAYNYKNYAEQKKKFLSDECKRIEDGYKKAINQVQQNFQTQEERHDAKVKELENQYAKKIEEMRLTLEYKNKC